jgi:hypothetical protein
MALRDWLFEAPEPVERDGRWWFEVRGAEIRTHGPFATEGEARAERHALFQRFGRAARARGGWAWRSTAARWVVTLPPEVLARGVPFRHAPCSRHR